MALLNAKKHIINSKGEKEELNIYTTVGETVLSGEKYKKVQIPNGNSYITGYLGLTDELDTEKASSKMHLIDGKQYAERKYLGKKSLSYAIKNLFPDTYQSITEIDDSLIPDASDADDVSNFYRNCSSLLSPNYIDTRRAKNFNATFAGCSSAVELPEIDTSKGTNFNELYNGCSSVLKMPFIDTSNGTSFYGTYMNCKSATDFPNIDTSNGINFTNMYRGCSSATKLPEINTSNATTVSRMYQDCSSLINLADLNTSKCTDFSYMFSGCANLEEVPEIDTSQGTNFSRMFSGCKKLKSIPYMDTSKGKNMDGMFYEVNSESFPILDTSSANNLSGIFYASNIKNVDWIDYSKTETMANIFYSCYSLTGNIYCNTKRNVDLWYSFMRAGISELEMDITSANNERCSNLNHYRTFESTSKLNKITFNDAPIDSTVESVKGYMTTIGNKELILNHREIRSTNPSKIIKAVNGRLVVINNDDSIYIDGIDEEQLDSYIFNSGEYGTVYDNGSNFKCFVTKDNKIYMNNSYNSTNKKDWQQSVDEGITIPATSIVLRRKDESDFTETSFIFVNLVAGKTGENKAFSSTYNNYNLIFTGEEGVKTDLCFSFYNYLSPVTSPRNCMREKYFNIPGNQNIEKPRFVDSIYIYHDLRYYEQFNDELVKLKTMKLSVFRDESSSQPELTPKFDDLSYTFYKKYENMPLAIFDEIDTSYAFNMYRMYAGCSNATKVSTIDLTKAKNSQLDGINITEMFDGCDSLRYVKFINVPYGTSEELLRSKTSLNSECQIDILYSLKNAFTDSQIQNFTESTRFVSDFTNAFNNSTIVNATIDLSMADDYLMKNMHFDGMFENCNELQKVIFINAPIGTIERRMRRICNIRDEAVVEIQYGSQSKYKNSEEKYIVETLKSYNYKDCLANNKNMVVAPTIDLALTEDVDLSNIKLDNMLNNCTELKSINFINVPYQSEVDLKKLTNAPNININVYNSFNNAFVDEENVVVDTSKCCDFSYMFYNNQNLIGCSDIDLSYSMKSDLSDIKMENMLSNTSLSSIRFVNCPIGVTSDLIREKTNASVDIEIIVEHGLQGKYKGTVDTEFEDEDTSKATNFREMYYGCSNATRVSKIDLSMAKDRFLSNIDMEGMFTGCDSLTSVTFVVPMYTDEELLRKKADVPSGCLVVFEKIPLAITVARNEESDSSILNYKEVVVDENYSS